MKYKLFYDKYRKTQIIFKEDLISDLVNILDLSEESSTEEAIVAIRISMLLRLTFYMFTIYELG